MVARGASNDEVAEQLVIARRTAETHVANIMKKLGLGSRAQLAVWWIARLR
jgi:non-specific serine/threonine protein kinase